MTIKADISLALKHLASGNSGLAKALGARITASAEGRPLPETDHPCILRNVRPQIVATGDHLEATLDHKRIFECYRCSGTLHERDASGGLFPCPAGRVAERARLFNEAQLPSKYFEAAPPKTDSRLDAFSPGDGGQWLSGDVGTGKTHQLISELWYLSLHRGIRCRYQDTEELMLRIRESYQDGAPETEAGIIAHFAGLDVLLLDDIGKRPSDHTSRILDALIDARYRRSNQCTTHVISNRSPEEMSKLSWDWKRVVSRLSELCAVSRIGGKDRRAR